MDDERDLLVFTDEDGNEIEMEVIDYFEYEGEEYAMLTEACYDDHDDECGCGCGCDEQEIFIMKVVVDGDAEDFVPVPEEKMEELIQYIQDIYDEEGEDEE